MEEKAEKHEVTMTLIRPTAKPALEVLLIPLAGIVGTVALILLLGYNDAVIKIFFPATVLLAVFLAAKIAIWTFASKYEISDTELIGTYNLIRQNVHRIPLDSIRDVDMDIPILGRVLNFGTIHMTMVSGKRLSIQNIPDPGTICTLLRQKIVVARALVNN